MSAAILAAGQTAETIRSNILRHFRPWELKAIGIVGAIGFAIGTGIVLYIRYTLAAQGIYKSMF